MTVSAYVQHTLVEPLGLRLSFGMSNGKVDDIVPVRTTATALVTPPDADPTSGQLLAAAGFGLLADPTAFNSAPLRAATLPAVSVVARARDLARLLAAMLGPVDGTRILQPATLDDLRATQSLGRDGVTGEISHFGSGVMLPSPRIPFLRAWLLRTRRPRRLPRRRPPRTPHRVRVHHRRGAPASAGRAWAPSP
jgi:hypothetical protein